MLLQITHDTRYHYAPAVENAQHIAYLQPGAHDTQTLLDHSLHINPEPSHRRAMTDVYGNTRCFFSLQKAHEVLSVIAHSLVSTQTSGIVHGQLAWEQVRESFRYQAGTSFDAASEFVFASAYVPRDGAFADYARPSFTTGVPLLQAVANLMQRIHSDFSYESQSTQINTPALDALAQRKGVCQDFSHIMIACLRTLGLPARYVSGYLLTQPAPGEVKLIGSDASHAWVSVYVPDLMNAQGERQSQRWCDFDPTNNRWGWHAPGPDYVTVATGRDFGDVSPLRGVIHGGARHRLTVGVTVSAVGDNAAAGKDLVVSQSQTQTQTQSQTPSQQPLQPQPLGDSDERL
ncbi:transglutaminase domain-containing protein [Rhodoferax sp.]|jgi:transglutaminase-like putative cysteine protease|uniref:transglutaminase family protein n=1 Tax=Rhodoferax sp. TaxID=50421 RepID=UPI0037846B58